jgi:phosphatidylglycerophosphate synthase
MRELKGICLDRSRETTAHLNPWERFFTGISIYCTRFFLELRMSANLATGLGLLCVLAGGALLVFPTPLYWFIGIILIAGWELFDYVDGQLARYNKTASLKGALWAGICHNIIDPYLIICLALGNYNALRNLLPVISGFMALMGNFVTTALQLLPVVIIADRRLSLDEVRRNTPKGAARRESTFIRLARLPFRFEGMVIILLIATAIDSLAPRFNISGYDLNARYVYFGLYGLALFINAIRRIWLSLRGELRIEV